MQHRHTAHAALRLDCLSLQLDATAAKTPHNPSLTRWRASASHEIVSFLAFLVRFPGRCMSPLDTGASKQLYDSLTTQHLQILETFQPDGDLIVLVGHRPVLIDTANCQLLDAKIPATKSAPWSPSFEEATTTTLTFPEPCGSFRNLAGHSKWAEICSVLVLLVGTVNYPYLQHIVERKEFQGEEKTLTPC